MKNIYITESQLMLIKESEDEVTYYEFQREAKKFMSDLLKDPIGAKSRELFTKHGIGRNSLIKKMRDCGLLTKKENIVEPYNEETGKKESTYVVSYKVPKKDFDKHMHRLYSKLFENKPKENIEECDAGSAMGGGASTAGNGATNASQSGQFTTPFMPVQRRPDPTMARFAGMSVQHEDDESSKDVNKRKRKNK